MKAKDRRAQQRQQSQDWDEAKLDWETKQLKQEVKKEELRRRRQRKEEEYGIYED